MKKVKFIIQYLILGFWIKQQMTMSWQFHINSKMSISWFPISIQNDNVINSISILPNPFQNGNVMISNFNPLYDFQFHSLSWSFEPCNKMAISWFSFQSKMAMSWFPISILPGFLNHATKWQCHNLYFNLKLQCHDFQFQSWVFKTRNKMANVMISKSIPGFLNYAIKFHYF